MSGKISPQKLRLEMIQRMECVLTANPGVTKDKGDVFTAFQYQTGASNQKTREYFDIVTGYRNLEFEIDGDNITFLTKEQIAENYRKLAEVRKKYGMTDDNTQELA